MNDIRPLPRQCSAPSCRKRLTIKASRFYFVTVPNRHGGTHKDGGFDCPSCGHPNVVPASHLPKGMLGKLPPRPQAAVAAAPTPPKRPAWLIGKEARLQLKDALIRASADPEGEAVVMVRARGGLIRSSSRVLGLPIDEALSYLDEIDCEFLMLSALNRSAGGARWRMLFDPIAGAASLVDCE